MRRPLAHVIAMGFAALNPSCKSFSRTPSGVPTCLMGFAALYPSYALRKFGYSLLGSAIFLGAIVTAILRRRKPLRMNSLLKNAGAST
jgi:hypothetical protein